MRSLKLLVEENETIWFFCRNEELANKFLVQCEEEGFIALCGMKPTELFRHHLYGISGDMTMGYLAGMIWSLTFRGENDDHVRIDYEKFCSDEEDFTYHRPDFSMF